MKMKAFVCLFALLYLASVSIASAEQFTVNQSGWWNQSWNYNASDEPIQAAINNASTGDNIIVKDGTYTEDLDVDKQLTLESENGSANCIIDGNYSGTAVKLSADGINFIGFTVKNALWAGIKIVSDDNIVKNNNITQINGNGGDGIILEEANNNTIKNNNVYSNSFDGTQLISSNNNTIKSNTFKNNERAGIKLLNYSDRNTLKNNYLTDHSTGIYLRTYNDDNEVKQNNLINNTVGLTLGPGCDRNLVANNSIKQNDLGGIKVLRVEGYESTSNNTIVYNNITDNLHYEHATAPKEKGIYLRNVHGNHIYLNNFANNRNGNIYSENSSNVWNSNEEITYTFEGSTYTSKLGNYWDDYNGGDPDDDGVGNSPYTISATDSDSYPLMNQVTFNNTVSIGPFEEDLSISLEKFTNGLDADEAPGPEITAGEEVTWTYNVTNEGNVPLSNVNVTDNQNVTPTYVEGDTDGDGKLDIGEKWTYEANGTARPGQYFNIGNFTANYSETTVTSEDDSHYFGKLSLEQRVSNLENKTEELQENFSELREQLEEQNETIKELKENQTILMVWKEEVNQFINESENVSKEIENLKENQSMIMENQSALMSWKKGIENWKANVSNFMNETREDIENLKTNQSDLLDWKDEMESWRANVDEFMNNTSENIEGIETEIKDLWNETDQLWNETESIWNWLEEHIPPGLQQSNPGKNTGNSHSEKAKDKGRSP